MEGCRMLKTRYTMRKKFNVQPKFVLVLTVGIVMLILLFRLLSSNDYNAAYETVSQFYKYEQASNFAESLELFHPYMKSKLSKNQYIQERNHVFMQHFGVSTFEFTIGKPQKRSDWSISLPPELPLLDKVIQFPVTKHFKSKFGTFDIVQQVVVT